MISYSTKQILKKVALYLILAIFLFVLTIEGSVGAFPFGLISILLLTSVFGLIAGLLHGKFTQPRMLMISRTILFVGLFVLITSFTLYKIQINQNFKNAATLVKSIDKYKNEHGDYPREIKFLIPNYIETIPSVKVGLLPRSFTYEYLDINDNVLKSNSENKESGYFLIYKGYLGVTYTYYSREGNWKLTD